MNELLSSMKKYVDDDEKILAFVVGIFEKDNFILSYQHGVFVATTRRLLFTGNFRTILQHLKSIHICI